MRRNGAALLLVLAATACPPQAPLVGTQCTQQGDCPSALFCVNGKCRSDHCDPDQSGTACAAGVGACSRAGTWSCNSGQPLCSAQPGPVGIEICNGIDDDCDGVVDDNLTDVGVPCSVGVGACLRSATFACSDGGHVCPAVPAAPTRELPNGIDDDCDGYVDDGALTTLAGSAPPGRDDGPAADASFMLPYGMVSDGRGNVFVADYLNHSVRRISDTPAGPVVSTVAGTGRCGWWKWSGCVSIILREPLDVELLANGDLYVSGLVQLCDSRVIHSALGPGVGSVETYDAGFTVTTPRGLFAEGDGGVWVVLNTLPHQVHSLNTSAMASASWSSRAPAASAPPRPCGSEVDAQLGARRH